MAHDVRGNLVNTVDSNKSNYTVGQYSNAKNACSLKDIVGPSTEVFIKYIEGDMIPDCNITRQNILKAEDIFRHNLGSVKGKTTGPPRQQVNVTWIQVPSNVLENMAI